MIKSAAGFSNKPIILILRFSFNVNFEIFDKNKKKKTDN